MNELLPYILKSTLSLGLLYLAFRTVMRRETYFSLNRVVLLTIVVCSIIIPLLHLPQSVKPIIHEQILPQMPFQEIQAPAIPSMETTALIATPEIVSHDNSTPYSLGQIILFIYLAGMLVSLFYFFHGILSVLFMIRKAQTIKKEGYRLFILEKDIPAFSFWRMIFISRNDYNEHGATILAHEQQHIRLGHFYDLLMMEIAKMVHWFNPVIYWLIRDLKAIHEYQADRSTLTKGVNVKNYQLLIIEKGVGPQRLALANSFNHCQIKKRITMMNQSKTSKARVWKVATFLPLLALLLMAFGRTGENVQNSSPTEKDMLNQEKTIVKESAQQSKDSIYSTLEVMPQFPGGQSGLNKFLKENMKYPEEAAAKNIQGKVFVNCIINKEGKIIDPKVVRSVDPLLDAEALRVVKLMPNWIPGKEKGKNVGVSFTLPLVFVLSGGPTDNKKIKFTPPIITKDTPRMDIYSKDKHHIDIYKNGSIKYNSLPISLEDFEGKVRSELQKNPKLQYAVSLEDGKQDERLTKIRDILKRNGNPEVSFQIFHGQAVTYVNGKPVRIVADEPLDIK